MSLELVPTPAHTGPSLIENGSASLFAAYSSGATIVAAHHAELFGFALSDDAERIR
jgi:hypothetical protein